MKHFLVPTIAVLLVAGCQGSSDPEPSRSDFFITTTGEHEIVPDSIAFAVFHEGSGKLNYRFSRKTHKSSSSFGSADAEIDLDAPWFAYVETSHRIWVCDGRARLDLLDFSEQDSGRYSVTHPCCPEPTSKMVSQIPKPVLERLPEPIRMKIGSSTSAPATQEAALAG